MWLQLRLTPPGNPPLIVDTDQVVFFAPPAIDLDTDSDNTHAIEHSDLEEKDEFDTLDGTVKVPGKIVKKNLDDDNGNGVPDLEEGGPWLDAENNPINDNDLVPLTLTLGRPAAEIPEYEVTLSAVSEGAKLKIWTEQHRDAPLALPITWDVLDMPTELFVEGLEIGQPTLKVELKKGMAVAGDDFVKFTVMIADAIAYRPFSFFSPLSTGFIPVPVPPAEEPTGVGIRLNGDGDVDPKDENGNPIGEDDLIRVDLDIGNGPAPWPPVGVGRKVGRSNNLINVWDSDNRTGAILTGQPENLADVPAGSQSIYVDWPSTTGGDATFEFGVWDTLHNNRAFHDEIVFKPFKSIVIMFVGDLQDPSDPAAAGVGMSAFAVEEYRKSGLDVHLFDEDDVETDGQGEPYDEIVTAINARGVKEVAIMGYSHGGGSTYFVSQRLRNNPVLPDGTKEIKKSFTVPFTGYVDAIMNDFDTDTRPERRRPELSLWHVGQYQRNGFPFGDTSGSDVDPEDRSALGVVHLTIDDNEHVQTLLRTELRDKVKPF